MSVCKGSQSINLPQLQNLIKRDPESYRDEVGIFWMLNEGFQGCISLTWWVAQSNPMWANGRN